MKLAVSPPAPVPQPHGGALLAGGVPGHVGGGGRPVEAFRRRCREALEEADGIGFLVRVVKGEEAEDTETVVGSGDKAQLVTVKKRPRIKDRLFALELLAEHGHGKPPQKLEVEAPERQETGEQNIARLLEMLPRVLAHIPIDQRKLLEWIERGKAREVLVSGRPVEGACRVGVASAPRGGP